MTFCIWGVLLVATSLSNAEKNETAQNWNVTTIATTTIEVSTTTTTKAKPVDLGPKLKDFACHRPDDCTEVDGTYCDADVGFCLCKPDYPVTDTNHCYKESKYDEFCHIDIQCQRRDKNTKCNRDFSLCECQPQYVAQSFNNGHFWCVRPTHTQNSDNGIGSFVDPTLFIILGAMCLMFIVLCVVLQLFAKAQFAENRSIFNTANPRLCNVSLLKDNKGHHQSTKKKTIKRNQSIDDVESGDPCGISGNTSNRKRSQATIVVKGHRRASCAAAAAANVAAATANANMNGSEDKIVVEMKDSRAA